ncbi:MAG: hypothetical protein JWM80_3310 [Cyanobacteria bacterium RYN_339]|nr:hypothetical protein [Cyanobacteria bacterium RYN_339]
MARSIFHLMILLVASLAGLSACAGGPFGCKFCGAPLFSGIVRTPEGFIVCKPCNKDGVRDVRTAQALVAQVRAELGGLGVRLPWGTIPMTLGQPANAKEWGHCEALRYGNGGVASISMRFMQGMPRSTFKAVAAHELTHAWAYLNRSPMKQDVTLAEGAPSFLEYTYLERDKSTAGKFRRNLVITNDNAAYGVAARRLQKYAKGHGGLGGVLAVLKSSRSIPKGY